MSKNVINNMSDKPVPAFDIVSHNISTIKTAHVLLSTNISLYLTINSKSNQLNKSTPPPLNQPNPLETNSTSEKNIGSTNLKQFIHKVSTGPLAEQPIHLHLHNNTINGFPNFCTCKHKNENDILNSRTNGL